MCNPIVMQYFNRLIYAGKTLRNNHPNGAREMTVADYALQKRSTLTVTLRLQGGYGYL